MQEAVETFDVLKERYESTPSAPLFGTTVHHRLTELLTAMQVHLNSELDAMPIWFVTPRRAYSIDVLTNNAERILDSEVVLLLSPRSLKDIREAGRAIAFDLPTAAGFHSVRAVEGIARAYHEIIVGTRPVDDTPLGGVIQGLRTQRDVLLNAGTIDKEDLLNIAIDMLVRVNNVYRKPIAHPDMILELSAAMNVFDSAKCAIELMLEDAQKKCVSPPIPAGFF